VTGDYFWIRRAPNGATEILHVSGELDLGSVPTLKRAVAAVAEVAQNGEICLDLSGLAFVDSTGAKALCNIHQTAEARGQRIIYASPQPQVRKVLELLGLDTVLRLTDIGYTRLAQHQV
jgi:anti-sigma B factor antagonist